MVVTKLSKRKRTQPDWLGNDVYPIFDLTKDGDGSGSTSVSDLNSSEDGRRSPSKTVASSSFDRGILLGDEEEDSLQFPSPAKKNPPIAMATCVEVQSQPNIELENHIERDAYPVIFPVESIQPPTKISGLYLIFSAEAVEVRGGDEECMIYEWPLESIVRIGIHYLSDKEEDTRAFVAITVSVPLCSLSRSSKDIDEYLLQLSNFRDSVVDISKLSPIFGSIIEELRKEDVEKTARTIKMQNSQTSNSLILSSLEEINKVVDVFKVLVYPQDDPDAVTITEKDIKILKPFEFLNDTIIDFYIKYLQQTCVSSEKLKTLHFFNSFFFSKLAEVGGKAAFERVKKWTRKVNVFEKDYVFIPVNHSLHWSLIIICHPGNIWEVPTTDGSFDGDACILHLDSMEGSHRGVDSHIRNYLYQEWIERNRDPKEAPYVEEFFFGMPYIYLKVPQQDNNRDCGLFLLHYVELFLNEAPSVYRMRRQRNPPTEFLRRNWFRPSEASAKRRVIQKLILELSQGLSSESVGEHTNRKEDSPDGVDEQQLTRALSVSSRGEKQHSAEPVDELGSNPSHQVNENCSSDRAEAMEMHVDVNPDDQDEHVKLRHVDARTEASECDDIRRDIHHTSSDQPNSSSKSSADQSSAHISAENDDLNSGHDPVHEAWNNERCPVPRLSIQVKPLQVPTLLDEEVQMYSQPPTVRGIQDGSSSSDELSSSYFDEDSKRSQNERPMLDFDTILSPKQVNTAGSDDEMYESSPKPRWSTSKVQHEVVSPVVATPENLPSTRVRSPELKEDGLTMRRPAKFRNSTPPFGRCSMQTTLNFGQRKETRRESHQQYGSFLVTEVEELSDDSDFETMPSAKKLEIEQRVTRSRTQISHGLPLSSEKQAKKDALDALRRKKGSRRR